MFRLNLAKMKEWYIGNIGKLLLFFIVVVVISLTSGIPYLSFILSPGKRFFIVSLCFYLIFPLSTNKLIFIAGVTTVLAFILTVLEMDFISEPLGQMLYLLLVFILVDYIKSIIKEKDKFLK